MKIYRVTKSGSLFDVFLGEGWKSWGRYKKVSNKFIHVKGIRLSDELLKQCEKEFKG